VPSAAITYTPSWTASPIGSVASFGVRSIDTMNPPSGDQSAPHQKRSSFVIRVRFEPSVLTV